MAERDWQLQEAKARLSEVVKLAQKNGPQRITVHGKRAVVVLSNADFEQLTGTKLTFLEFLRASPLKGAKLEITRDKSKTRDSRL